MKSLFRMFFIFSILSFPAFSSILGDVNGDGNITSLDALLALQMSIGRLEGNGEADVDGNGRITAFDAFMILKLATGHEINESLELDSLIFSLYNYRTSPYLTNAKINLRIRRNNGKVSEYGIRILNGTVTEIIHGSFTKPDFVVYASERTVKRIGDSRDKAKAVSDAIKREEITIKGNGISNFLKASAIKYGSGLGGLGGKI